jgi:hypothetical protein
MTVAVNIADLDTLLRGACAAVARALLADFCGSRSPVVAVGRNVDDQAVVLDGPAAGEDGRTAALVGLLQESLGPRKLGRRVRCYRQNRAGGWTEIRGGGRK